MEQQQALESLPKEIDCTFCFAHFASSNDDSSFDTVDPEKLIALHKKFKGEASTANDSLDEASFGKVVLMVS